MNEDPRHSGTLVSTWSALSNDWWMASRQRANTFSQKFFQTGNLLDGHAAIMSGARPISLMAKNDPETPVELANLASVFMRCFELSGELGHLERAITTQRAALSLVSNFHPWRFGLFTILGVFLNSRFERSNDITDLEEAIHCHMCAFLFAPDDDKNIPIFASNLGGTLARRFMLQDNSTDLYEAIECFRLAASSVPVGHLEKPKYSNNLGLALRDRFRHLGCISDIDEAIKWHREAISLETNSGVRKLIYIAELAVSLKERFEQSNILKDVDETIELCRMVLAASPPIPAAEFSYVLRTLCAAFSLRFDQVHDMSDLREALDHSRSTFLSTTENHPEKVDRVLILASVLRTRFKRLGDPTDVDQAVEYLEQGLSSGSNQKTKLMNNLGLALYDRFGMSGNLVDLDRAIEYLDRSANLTPDVEPVKPSIFSNLGLAFERRSEHLGSSHDLETAIRSHREALSLSAKRGSPSASYLNNLGLALARRFDRSESSGLSDIDEAVQCYVQAVALTPSERVQKWEFLDNLGTAYGRRFKHSNELADIDHSIKYQEQAIASIYDGHPETPSMLNNLGVSYGRRFGQSGDPCDIGRAIDCQKRAVAMTPDGHLQKPRFLTSLSFSIMRRLSRGDNAVDSNLVLGYTKEAAKAYVGPAMIRFVNARQWAQMTNQTLESRLEAYETAMKLVPRLIWLGATVDHRYEDAVTVGDLATEAAAFAISIGRYDQALDWLEEGRSIIWRQQLQLRTPLDEIRVADFALAVRLQEIGKRLEIGASRRSEGQGESLEQAARDHRRAAEAWDQAMAEVRRLPGFETFLQPMEVKEILRTARRGVVAVINVHTSRCDALVIQPKAQAVTHIPLPRFSFEKALKMQESWAENLKEVGARSRGIRKASLPLPSSLKGGEILTALWTEVVEPILDKLDLLRIHSSNQLPHITWCATGPLAFLPVHAAGCYNVIPPQRKTWDYVISSYTPTLSALLPPARRSDMFRGLLAVGQDQTAGLSPLLHAVEEIQQIAQVFGDLPASVLSGDQATVEEVLKGMKESSWIHLACHAVQDGKTPSESAFFLSNGRLNLATIMKQPLEHAEFAFLSACQTALGHKDLPEEAIHLAAGMLMAGYPTVIGTMWSIQDRYAPVVASRVYARLVKAGRPDTDGVADALHWAVAELRNEIGESRVEDWAPFVHLGV